MGISVTSVKYYNQFVNAEDFLTSTGVFDTLLTANSAELIQALYRIKIEVRSDANATNLFTVTGALGANEVTRQSGSFLNDGFIIGDILRVFDGGVDMTTTDRTITYVDNTKIIFDGAAVSSVVDQNDIIVRGKSAIRGFKFKYNLVENNGALFYQSIQDTSNTIWKFNDVGIGAVGARSTTFVSGTFSVLPKTAQTGSARMRFVSDIDAYTQEFEIEHTFRVIPFFLESERAQFEAGTPISWQLNAKAYRVLWDLRGSISTIYSNPNELKGGEWWQRGNTGWFNETFNGDAANFALNTITYTDSLTATSVTGLQINRKTSVEVIITSPTGVNLDANHVVIVNSGKLPDIADLTSTSDWETNYVFDSKRQTRGAAAVASSFIKNLVVSNGSPASDKLKVNFDIEFTAGQQALMSEDDKYYIGIHVGDVGNLAKVRTNVLAEKNAKYIINRDTSGLFAVEEVNFYTHDMDVEDYGTTDFKGFTEDGVLMKAILSLDTALAPVLQTLRFKVVAYDTVAGDEFTISQRLWFLGNSVISPGNIQQLYINQLATFQLKSDNPFNIINLEPTTMDGTKQLYEFRCPFKIDWMDYQSLSTVDSVFYNAGEPNNGLNREIHRYSQASGFEVRVYIEADVNNSDGDSTIYRTRLPYIDLYDYDEDNGMNVYSAHTIAMFNVAGVAVADDKIIPDADTRIKATFTPTTPVATSVPYWGIIRIEEYQNGGLFSIDEMSSEYLPRPNNRLKPMAGETKLKVTNNGTTIVLECLIDYTKINVTEGFQYHISARIGEEGVAFGGKRMEDGTYKKMESGTQKILE